MILEEEAEVLEDPSSSPPTGQLTTRNFCEQSAQTDELPLYASAFRSYNEVGTTTDSDLVWDKIDCCAINVVSDF